MKAIIAVLVLSSLTHGAVLPVLQSTNSLEIPPEFNDQYPLKGKLAKDLSKAFGKFQDGNCCGYHWLFSIDNSAGADVTKHQIIQWAFKAALQFETNEEECLANQKASTVSYCDVPTTQQMFKAIPDFDFQLPDNDGADITNYATALTSALELIDAVDDAYYEKNTCVVFISDGGSAVTPWLEIFAYATVFSGKKEDGFCMCSMCLFTGEGALDRNFRRMCKAIDAKVIRNKNPWKVATGFLNEVRKKLFNEDCCQQAP